MVESIHNGPQAVRKTISSVDTSTNLPAHLFVDHPALSMTDQVQILSIVDGTGTATIGDIVSELPGHPEPVEAIMALIGAGVLIVLSDGLCDLNTMVARKLIGTDDPSTSRDVPLAPKPQKDGRRAGKSASTSSCSTEASCSADEWPLIPLVTMVDKEKRRQLARTDDLKTPGIYIQVCRQEAYVGFSRMVGERASTNTSLDCGRSEMTFVITSEGRPLSEVEAKALEYIMWLRVVSDTAYSNIQSTPNGGAISPEQFRELSLFAAQVCFTLRDIGLMFQDFSDRRILAGPVVEKGRLGRKRHFDEPPPGTIKELHCVGLTAHAAVLDDGRWLLLAGSQIRRDPPNLATAMPFMYRAVYLHFRILKLSADERCYELTHDVFFESGTSAALFVSGTKGYGPRAWTNIEPTEDELEALTV